MATVKHKCLDAVHGGYDPFADWASSGLGYGMVVPEYSEEYWWPPSPLDEDLAMGESLGAPYGVHSRALEWDV